MKFILILLSMMFVFTLMAIPIDVDVGVLNSYTVVYTKPEAVAVPAQTVITRLNSSVVYEFNRQYTLPEGNTVERVGFGSINRFVLVNDNSTYDNIKGYTGHSFDCVNKLL